jgi:hypothetical protein
MMQLLLANYVTIIIQNPIGSHTLLGVFYNTIPPEISNNYQVQHSTGQSLANNRQMLLMRLKYCMCHDNSTWWSAVLSQRNYA